MQRLLRPDAAPPLRGIWCERRSLTGWAAGQAAVELALILPVLALITMGILDLGRVFYTYVALINAAREGARYCVMKPSSSAFEIRKHIQIDLGGIPLDVPNSVINCSPATSGNDVTITLVAPFRVITPVIKLATGDPINIRVSATMLIP